MTKDERIALLLMDDARWKGFKLQAASYYEDRGEAPLECFREMTEKVWGKYLTQLEILRVEQRPAIERRRKEEAAKVAAAKRKKRKAVYMREYMVIWRRNKADTIKRKHGESNGQRTTDGGAGVPG